MVEDTQGITGEPGVTSTTGNTGGNNGNGNGNGKGNDRRSSKRVSGSRSNGRSSGGERSSKSGSNNKKRANKTGGSSSRRKTETANGTDPASGIKNATPRTLKKSTSMSDFKGLVTGTMMDLPGTTTTKSTKDPASSSRKANRRRTASSVEPTGRSNKSRSRSSSPRRSLTSGLQDLKNDQTNKNNTKVSATTATTAEGSQTSSSLDASEKQQRKKKNNKSISKGPGDTGTTTATSRRGSRRNLLMDSSSRKLPGSRRTLSDGSNKDRDSRNSLKGAMSDTSQPGSTALDVSRVSSSSMEASGKDNNSIGASTGTATSAGTGVGGSNKRRSLLESARERPSMKDVSSRRKMMMTESSERYSSMQDVGSSNRRKMMMTDSSERYSSMKDFSNRRKMMMTASSERYSSMQDIKQSQQQRRNSDEAAPAVAAAATTQRLLRRNSNDDGGTFTARRGKAHNNNGNRKAALERSGSSRRTIMSISSKAEYEDIPEMKEFDMTDTEPDLVAEFDIADTGETYYLYDGGTGKDQIGNNLDHISGNDINQQQVIPDTEVLETTNEQSTDRNNFGSTLQNAADNTHDGGFGHLPDFQVSDFSFRDLNFPLDSKDDLMVDNAKAAELSTKEEAKNNNKQQQQQPPIKQDNAAAAAEAAETRRESETSKSVASASKANHYPSGNWVCQQCQEEHDESELHFCGMCGADRPKTSTTNTPKQKKTIRKSSVHGSSSSTKRKIRRSSTMPSSSQHQKQEDSGSRSATSRKSAPTMERPASAGTTTPRKIRSHILDQSGPTKTPRSRSKGKVRSGSTSNNSRDQKDIAMIVKCLDGDEGGQAMDMELLNQQLTTFEPLMDPPMTPMRRQKKSLRRCQSDVAENHHHHHHHHGRMPVAGKTPTSSAPQTPKTLGKKKVPLQRSRSFADAPGTPGGSGGANGGPGGHPLMMMRKPSIRQAIPRRAKSSTTEYLQQLQQTKNNNTNMDISGHSTTSQNNNSNNNASTGNAIARAADQLKAQSAHSLGAQSAGAQSLGSMGGGRPSLAGMRQSMMKSASQRFLGGLSGIASTTFAMGGGVTNVMGNMPGISPFSKPRGDAQLLNSDDEDDDENDEFASEVQQTDSGNNNNKGPGPGFMLRDFPVNNDLDFTTKSPRVGPPRSSRNLMANYQDDVDAADGGGGGGGGVVTKTPRRRRATIAAARQAGLSNRDDIGGGGGVTKTPRRRRNFVDPRGGSNERKIGGFESGALDYDDIDIDEGDGEEFGGGDDAPPPNNESLGYAATTPRRARERLARSMARRPGSGGGSLAKSEHGAVTPKGLNARSRIRRASLTGFQVGALPDLDGTPEPSSLKAPPTPGTLNARSRLRRASLGGGIQAEAIPTLEPPTPGGPRPIEENELTAVSGHGRALRGAGGRPGRRRRGSIETSDPMLQQALAHMSQDPTHAVRSDLQEEWKRQEQMEDMRKKAKQLHKRYGGGALSGAVQQPEPAPLFEAEFDTFDHDGNHAGGGGGEIDDGEESGADLELAGDDQDVSDLSSHDGDEFA